MYKIQSPVLFLNSSNAEAARNFPTKLRHVTLLQINPPANRRPSVPFLPRARTQDNERALYVSALERRRPSLLLPRVRQEIFFINLIIYRPSSPWERFPARPRIPLHPRYRRLPFTRCNPRRAARTNGG